MTSELVLDTPLQSQKTLVWWLYIFHAISLVFSLGMLSFIPFFTIILMPLAWLIWCLAWIWKAYRLIKGIIYLNDNKAMPV